MKTEKKMLQWVNATKDKENTKMWVVEILCNTPSKFNNKFFILVTGWFVLCVL